MRTRQQLEQNELTTLEPYAAMSCHSLGRMYPEEEHPYRTAFQRDRDRIVHTSAFRRLEYKTQVFVNHEGDYYRTRLTHTLEVAQIGRTIARALGVNENLTEAICLAHDLGHTPFGHSGQDSIAPLMKVFGGFEHNKQSFRIVTLLERSYPDFVGLNLTYEVLEGITKHASEYDMPDGTLFIKKGYPTIEAQIANIADEIAYNNHDIDDGLQSGLLKVEDLNEVEIWRINFTNVAKIHDTKTIKHLKRTVVKSIINLFVTDLIENTAQNIDALKIKTLQDVRDQGRNLVCSSDKIKKMNIELKKFLFENMYRHEHVEKMARLADEVIHDLFAAYTQDIQLIPADFLAAYNKKEPVERIVCDYIAGMTDRVALNEHKKIKP